MRALLLTNPVSDRGKITSAKGNLVANTCTWIKEVEEFKGWLRGQRNLLWISGGPGKGKTFLSIHLAETLPSITGDITVDNSRQPLILEFYCDNSDSRRNTARSVLRGLLYQLLKAEDRLYNDILPEYELHQNIFNDGGVEELWRIFNTMIGKVQRQVYVLLDGLDECDERSVKFLQRKLEALHPTERTDERQNIKIVLVSRKLRSEVQNALKIDLDQEHVERREEDLNLFIQSRIQHIPSTYQGCVQSAFLRRANGTFLWVALAISVLEDKTEEVVSMVLRSESALDTWLPRGLDAMYNRIITDIPDSEWEPASKIIRCVCISFRPLTVAEVCALTGLADEQVEIQVKNRANLLSRAENGQLEPVHFSLKEHLLCIPSTTVLASIPVHDLLLHASSTVLKRVYLLYAVDFVLFTNILGAIILFSGRNPFSLTARTLCFSALCSVALYTLRKSPVTHSLLIAVNRSLKVYVFGIQEQGAHTNMLLKSLALMSGCLKENGCYKRPGTLVTEMNERELETYLYPAVQYTCLYWIQHLQKSGIQLQDNDQVHQFLRKHVLHWLEGLGWMRRLYQGIHTITLLETLTRVRQLLRAPR